MRTHHKVLLGAAGSLVLLEIGVATGITVQHIGSRTVPAPIPAVLLPYTSPGSPGIKPFTRPAPVPNKKVHKVKAPVSRG